MKDILLLKSNRKHLWQRKADVVVVWLFTLLLMFCLLYTSDPTGKECRNL